MVLQALKNMGAGVLDVCRVRLPKNGYAGQPLGEQPALLLLRGKAGRSEAPPGLICDALTALIEAGPLPACASLTPQARPAAAHPCLPLQGPPVRSAGSPQLGPVAPS